MDNKKRNFIIIILFFSIFILASVCLVISYQPSHPITQRDFEEIKSSGVLNIVMEYNSMDYYIAEDTIRGVQYDLSKFIEKRSGLKINIFLENNLEKIIQKLENNEYDIIAQNIPVTNEWKEELTFTVPISSNKQVLVQRKKNDTDTTLFIFNQLDLAEKTIHVPQNSPILLRIQNLAEEIAHPINIEENKEYTAEQLIYMVAYNEIDYAVVDHNIAVNNLTLFPHLDINTDISFTQLRAWAIRKDNPILLDSLNSWITEYLLIN